MTAENIDREQRVWLEMLRIAFLEIRALDDATVARARKLANIYHNVPTALFGAPESWEREKKALFARARAAGLEEFIRRDLAHVEETMK